MLITETQPYFDPTLPGNAGIMVSDDEGNYGYGRTPKEAMRDFEQAAAEGA